MDDEAEKPNKAEASEAAKALSSLGASKGGKARKNVLSPEHRREIAQKAVRARWMKAGKLKELEADNGDRVKPPEPAPPDPRSPDGLPFSMFQGTLDFGNITMEAHVLNDGRRVFSQREIVKAISGGRTSGDLKVYLSRNPLMDMDLFAAAAVQFRIPGNPTPSNGSEATLLVDICDRYIEAKNTKKLKPSQYGLAVQAEVILRACAKVGIIALVDEATGYQKVRAERALRLKLQAFIAEELQDWARMFPEEFWLELARLEGIRYSPRSRPLRWGKYIMMFVYDAVDPDVGRTLRAKNPNPRFLKNHHQWLQKFGRDKVHDQIERVITVMKLCNDMTDFREKFARVFRKSPLQTTFDDLDWSIGPKD